MVPAREPRAGTIYVLRRHRWTWDSGPALTGSSEVFTTWMPASCSPLNGVTVGEVAPGSQPRLNGTLGLLNQTPRWYWWVGENVVVPPSDTKNVGASAIGGAGAGSRLAAA